MGAQTFDNDIKVFRWLGLPVSPNEKTVIYNSYHVWNLETLELSVSWLGKQLIHQQTMGVLILENTSNLMVNNRNATSNQHRELNQTRGYFSEFFVKCKLKKTVL